MTTYRSTRAFGADEIRTFLRAVDRHLTRRTCIEILDTFTPTTAELEAAVARTTQESGLKMPLLQAGVADVPINYEDRLERQLPELEMLEVWVLEKHDLALSKAAPIIEAIATVSRDA